MEFFLWTDESEYPYQYQLQLVDGDRTITRMFRDRTDRDAAMDIVEYAKVLQPNSIVHHVIHL